MSHHTRPIRGFSVASVLSALTMALVIVLAILLPVAPWPAAQPVFANAGPPMRGGELAAEPSGLDAIHILSEALDIDLRPLSRAEPVHVSATYILRNEGSARDVALMFVTASNRVQGLRVTLNDQSVPASLATLDPTELPAAWRPPAITPGLDSRDLGYYPASMNGGSLATAMFKPHIPAGQSALSVQYTAEAVRYNYAEPTVHWQFGYSLAPARAWASFGLLQVTVHVPSGWRAAAAPSLTQTGDTLRGAFKGVPADTLALTVRAYPSSAYALVTSGLSVLVMAALAIGLVAVLRASWRRGSALRGVWPVALGASTLWAIAVFLIGVMGRVVPTMILDASLPEQTTTNAGYGAIGLWLGLTIGCIALVPTGWVGGVITGALARRRAGRPGPR